MISKSDKRILLWFSFAGVAAIIFLTVLLFSAWAVSCWLKYEPEPLHEIRTKELLFNDDLSILVRETPVTSRGIDKDVVFNYSFYFEGQLVASSASINYRMPISLTASGGCNYFHQKALAGIWMSGKWVVWSINDESYLNWIRSNEKADVDLKYASNKIGVQRVRCNFQTNAIVVTAKTLKNTVNFTSIDLGKTWTAELIADQNSGTSQ